MQSKHENNARVIHPHIISLIPPISPTTSVPPISPIPHNHPIKETSQQ